METLEALSRRIGTTEDLKSIVHTMKSLSAVSIRQYEDAVAALQGYARTVELGFQVVMPQVAPPSVSRRVGALAAVVFGSDHGLVGRFNEQISDFARVHADDTGSGDQQVFWLAVGGRVAARLEAAGEPPAQELALPSSPDGLIATARAIVLLIDRWRLEQGVDRVLVMHNRRTDQATASPVRRQLLPLDQEWLAALLARPWPSHCLPTYSMATESLLRALVREHLFLLIYRAGAESIASEHATRLAAMQAAEHNIDESLEELEATYRRRRQESITEELLDVVAGFEVLRPRPRRVAPEGSDRGRA